MDIDIMDIERLWLLSSACTRSRIHVSQIAVLSAVAMHSGCRLSFVVEKTGMSDQHVCRVIAYLEGTNDIKAIKRKQGRRFFLTPQGARTIRGLIRMTGTH